MINETNTMLHTDLYADGAEGIIRTGLTEASGDVFLINPTQQTMQEFVEIFSDSDRETHVKLFADRGPLKDLAEDFLVASTIADRVAEGTLAVRSFDQVPRHSLLLTEEFLVSLVETGDRAAGLVTTEAEFVESTIASYRTRWEVAEPFSLRTPPLSEVRESLEAEIGAETAADFDRMLDALETARGNGEGLDEVTIALLVAAKNRELLYSISRWGEDVRLASKATFSRSKNQLEDEGIIDTEKVPIDVGRPRLRLKLGTQQLRAADVPELTARVQELLAD
jgi:hypothetical protein